MTSNERDVQFHILRATQFFKNTHILRINMQNIYGSTRKRMEFMVHRLFVVIALMGIFVHPSCALPNDQFEPNDTLATTMTISLLAGSLREENLYLAESNEDWFALQTPTSVELDINIIFAKRNDGNDNSDLELAIYNSAENKLDIADSSTDNENITYLSTAGETIYIKEWDADNTPWGGATSSLNSYTL